MNENDCFWTGNIYEVNNGILKLCQVLILLGLLSIGYYGLWELILRLFYIRLSSLHTIYFRGYIEVSGINMGICLYRGGDEFEFKN